MFNKLFKRSRRDDSGLKSGDEEFLDDLRASLIAQKTPGSRLILYLIGVVFLVGVVWAYFARVEEITVGEATVIAKSREQVIESLEGGILKEMLVREGAIVDKGDVLLRIDPTRAKATYREAYSKMIGLEASISRLRAEAYDQPISFTDAVKAFPDIVQKEEKAYQSRKRALSDAVSALEKSYVLSIQEIELAEPLAAQGLMSEVELLRMRRQANDIKSQIVERTNKFRAEANAELVQLELELSQVKENLVGRADVLDRTTIKAPLRGTVKNVRVTTVGGVIKAGEPILEIVPLEDQLLVEAKIRPSDVAFISPGLPATVKITAYDYSIYGGLKGTVQHISPDTLEDTKKAAAGRPDDTYYRVIVLTDSSELSKGGKSLPIIPGMLATVEIRTGEKTILDYLLKPVLKGKEAFRER
ncbi:HlyD family type I secretion periplasmic adaptor subunit [Microbulbifer pacificus]|uniref:HlyD family type I secretion periplasmic adaptor subunit n=1 Tax=Microbulbifer pacificus TaxID=407164 RepID=UPI000CF49747|nr:HlyD family type I secretion periplasmic adaptor subunit [Microbulbifer pacificus]